MENDELIEILQQMAELQRYKLLNEEEKTTEKLEKCRQLFNKIMLELGVKERLDFYMDVRSMETVLLNIRTHKAGEEAP